MKSIY